MIPTLLLISNTTIGISVAAFIILLFIISTYNNLISKRNDVEFAFSSIDVMLKKRYDLIPNLISAVKQYMQHEKSLLNELTQLRTQAMRPNLSDKERFQLEQQLSSQIKTFQVAVENYPNLKASSNFIQLQRTLTETEEQISAARRTFNAAINAYNTAIETFPGNLVAGLMQLKRKASFEITAAERANVDVNKLFN